MSHYQWQQTTLVLRCHIQPGAKTTGFAGLHGDKIKIRIAAAPVAGKANNALVEFLSTSFAVAKSQVAIIQGVNSRAKVVKIENPKQFPQDCLLDSPNI